MAERTRGNSSKTGLVALAFIAFISLGMPDGLLGVAWPGIRASFNLPLDAMGLILLFGTAGYMLSSFFSGMLVRRLGVGLLLALSVAATSMTLLVYAVTPVWWLFAVIAGLGGLGAGAIDAGLNMYIAQNHGESLMQWLHASFGVGITAGPFIMTAVLNAGDSWRPGYYIVAAVQAVLALGFFLTRNRWKDGEPGEDHPHHQKNQAGILETLRQIGALLSMLMFFLYTGVELGLGLWSYTLLTEGRGVSDQLAGIVTGSYWGMFTLGRILAGLYARKLPIRILISGSLMLAAVGLTLLLLKLGPVVSVAGIALSGFAVAPIFPGLVSDTGNRVGLRYQDNTIGMQIAAAGLGMAIIPSIAGVLARRFGLEVIPVFMLINTGLILGAFLFSHGRRIKKEAV